MKRKVKVIKKNKSKKTLWINLALILVIAFCSVLMLFTGRTMAAPTSRPDSFTGDRITGSPSWDPSHTHIKYASEYGQDTVLYCFDFSIPFKEGGFTLDHSFNDTNSKGLAYIILNGYPHKNNYNGNALDENAITQWAIWIYKDMYYIEEAAENWESEKAQVLALDGIGDAIQSLVDGATAARNAPAPVYNLSLDSNLSFSVSGSNYVTNEMGISQDTSFASYSVEFTAPSGSYLTKNGERVSGNTFNKSDKFQLVIPTSSVTPDNLNVTVTVNASGTVQGDEVYIYNHNDNPPPTEVPYYQTTLLAMVFSNQINRSDSRTATIPYARLRVLKVDADTGEPVAGAKLRLLDSDGSTIEEWVTTTEAKEFTNLIAGKTYTVEEVSPATGYVNHGKTESITLTAANSSTPAVLRMENEATKIQVGKIDLNTGNYIAGATLRIINQVTGEVYLDNIVTTTEPTLITNIPVGTYVLQEVAAPAGYVLNPTSLKFTVTNTGSVQQVFIKNNYTYVSIADQKISIDLSISGFKIEIKNSAGEVVDSYTTDGKVHTTEELEAGRYTIEEVEAPAGYLCYPTPIEVYVPEKGTVAANEIYFPNDYTKVQISKVDITTSEELPGAEIEIRNEDGEVVEKWTSSDTPHEIERLPVGSYELVETIAPEGYQLQENSVQFEVLETGEIQSVVMYNEPKIEVPDTASQASVVTYICGIVIVLCGIGLVLYNVKEHKKKKRK